MQEELDADGTQIQIIGVNQVGYESSNDLMSDGRNMPWLQETASLDVWGLWEVTYRDVIVVDATGKPMDVYNLSSNDLGDEANYAVMIQMLRDGAVAR